MKALEKVKVALAGLGRMGMEYHCQILHQMPSFLLTAGFDIVPERLRLAQAEFGLKPFSNWREFLASDEFRLLVIASPSNLHAKLSIQAMAAGKDVVVEKPMCMNLPEADAMIAAARRNGVMLSVFQNRRWDPEHLLAKKVIEEGLLGEIYYLKMIRLRYSDLMLHFGAKQFRPGWRAERAFGGGLLYDFGAHYLDQLCELLPSEPLDVYGHLEKRLWSKEVDDGFLAIICFEDGAVGQVEVSHTSHLPATLLHIMGSKGTLSGNKLKTQVQGEEEERELELPPRDWEAYYRNIHAVLTQGAELAVKPQEVRKVIQIMDAIRESAETRRVVRMG